jgi:hypothetical protein
VSLRDRLARLRLRTRDERGQGVLELSVVLPVILLLLTGMLEFGLAYNDLLTIGYATREGSRAGAALATGGATSCSGSSDPAGVDKAIIASVERILASPGSGISLADVSTIRIYRAGSNGQPSGSEINVWGYSPSGGPDVDPGPGAARLSFVEQAHGWDACRRNAGSSPDSIGVQVVYAHRLTTPLAAFMEAFGGRQATTIVLRDQTVMALNPVS